MHCTILTPAPRVWAHIRMLRFVRTRFGPSVDKCEDNIGRGVVGCLNKERQLALYHIYYRHAAAAECCGLAECNMMTSMLGSR